MVQYTQGGASLSLPGAIAPTRYAGGTTSGAPVSGTFAGGDFIIDESGSVWICTVAGTPGTWVNAGAAGSGTVTSVAAADMSIVIGGTPTVAPTVRTGTLDVIAAQHPPAADWSNNSHKITSLANGSGAQDAAAFGQLPSAGTPLALASGGTGLSEASNAALLAGLGAAPLASPALTGTPTAPTAAPATNSTQLATTAYADAIAALKLALTGGTMSGAIAMGAQKITGLANGSSAQDAAAFGQILALQATTGAAGYTLVNGTGNIITWTAPNDGNMHRVVLMAILLVTTTEVGGSLNVAYTLPNGTAENSQVIVGAQTPGAKLISTAVFLIEANTAFTFQQASALTSGAAVAWAEIWAS